MNSSKQKIHYFSNTSMLGLYGGLEDWQEDSGLSLVSVNIVKEGDEYYCIALSGSINAVICDELDGDSLKISNGMSDGKCLFIMAVEQDREGRDVRQQIIDFI